MPEPKEPTVYEHTGEAVFDCKCGKQIFMKDIQGWKAKAPIRLDTGHLHFIDCPFADSFRKAKKK